MKKDTVEYEAIGSTIIMGDDGEIAFRFDGVKFRVTFIRNSDLSGTITIESTDSDVSYSVPADLIIKELEGRG